MGERVIVRKIGGGEALESETGKVDRDIAFSGAEIAQSRSECLRADIAQGERRALAPRDGRRPGLPELEFAPDHGAGQIQFARHAGAPELAMGSDLCIGEIGPGEPGPVAQEQALADAQLIGSQRQVDHSVRQFEITTEVGGLQHEFVEMGIIGDDPLLDLRTIEVHGLFEAAAVEDQLAHAQMAQVQIFREPAVNEFEMMVGGIGPEVAGIRKGHTLNVQDRAGKVRRGDQPVEKGPPKSGFVRRRDVRRVGICASFLQCPGDLLLKGVQSSVNGSFIPAVRLRWRQVRKSMQYLDRFACPGMGVQPRPLEAAG